MTPEEQTARPEPFAFGCRGCNRIAKTERALTAAGCEGTHEALFLQRDCLPLDDPALRELVTELTVVLSESFCTDPVTRRVLTTRLTALTTAYPSLSSPKTGAG